MSKSVLILSGSPGLLCGKSMRGAQQTGNIKGTPCMAQGYEMGKAV